MQILTLSDILLPTEGSVLTVGNFDGVHRGHRQLFDKVLDRARISGLRSIAVTFEPHTRGVTTEGNGSDLLTTFEEKARLIELLGIDYLMKVPFDTAMRRNSPESFIADILSGRLRMKEWVLGQGHAIGKDRAGNEQFLHAMEGKYHFKTFVADLLTLGGGTVSSTLIRNLIDQGSVTEAVALLGHPYLVAADRTTGLKIGRTLGYPTLNFTKPLVQKVIPPPGVYVAELEYHGTVEQGSLYYGECPTLGGHREVHFEFFSFARGAEEIATGDRAWLWMYAFVRADRTFASTEELVQQIKYDVETTKTFFTKEKKQWR